MGRRASVVTVLAIVLAGCGTTSTDGRGDQAATVTTVPAASTTAVEGSDGSGGSDDPPPAATGGRGSAVLTIGDETYRFDNYYCARGAADTRNDNVPFSSGAFGEVDGNRAQLDASVYDPDADDRMEGSGVVHSVTLDDIDDFDNPVVGWSAESGFFGEASFAIEYDGTTVRVEATFDDTLTDEIEEIPGTLEATCGG